MSEISPKNQLLLLLSFYCCANILSLVMNSGLLTLTFHQMTSKVALGLVSVITYLVPTFILFKLTSRTKVRSHWRLNVCFSIKSVLLTIMIIACCIVVMAWLAEINKAIPLFDWMKNDEVEASIKLNKYLTIHNRWDLLINLFFLSVIPAFCEEVFFRGTMQPLLSEYLANGWIAIFVTALLFSFMHFLFLGFIPRVFAGMVLGGIFYYSGSLWLSVLGHMLYNGSLVIFNYITQYNKVGISFFEKLLLNPYLLLASSVMMVALFYLLRKESKRLSSRIKLLNDFN